MELPQTGRIINSLDKLRGVDAGDDDEYFHLTCHVDNSMKEKIENGEFIELEKLLPRKKGTADNRFEWINKDGMTFLSPVGDRGEKITNIRRWDQAFRIYAAIYCNANPGRSGEIWQYIYTIHSAASSYIWDNVAYYDHTFRQMMADRPYRSWSKNYAQLWQLALRDPLPKATSSNSLNYRDNNESGGTGGGRSGHKKKTWRDCCCWDYNRTGTCQRANCPFDNRCSYCGAWSHGAHSCHKKKKNDNNKTGNGSGQGGVRNK